MFKDINSLFEIRTEPEFLDMALKVFHYQYSNNSVYREWADAVKTKVNSVESLQQIPFLPVEFFKNKKVVCGETNENTVCFTSSSTTSQIPSTHYVTDIAVYERSFRKCFDQFYGNIQDLCILALLPGYLDRQGSSLVYMCNDLISNSRHPLSGFYLRNLDELIHVINTLKEKKQKTIIIGVSYALMDLADKGIMLNDCFTVIETGGMKGTRKEMLKEELHRYLSDRFMISQIESEYGMTELLSQAYSKANGLFEYPSWMRFLIRDINDPFSVIQNNKTGGINIIDLANVNSCSFIATKDLGRIDENGRLQLMGRYDNSDVRGCNLMVS